MHRVFIDGSAGTTGLRIRERLSGRGDLELITLPEELRKDTAARRDALNSADVAFLCLPDAAAVEAAAMVENPHTVAIDTSTAHRVADGWEYGMPELAGRRERIRRAKRIANPGCHASGFIALVAPLVSEGLVSRDVRLCCFSLTGYSGGGKKMIAEYNEKLEGATVDAGEYSGGRQYALGQSHKHLPEMAKVCGLTTSPVFSPIVVPHMSGMEVTVQLFADQTKGGLEAIRECYARVYRDNGTIRYAADPAADEGGFLSSARLAGSDSMEVSAYGNNERIVLVSRFDNLGKGASGAAIQNMNIVLGCDEKAGLVPPRRG